MTISFKLITTDEITADGYPLVVKFSHKQQRPQKQIGYSFPEHFIEEEQMISVRHPDYDILAPIMADIKVKAKKIILQQVVDPYKARELIFQTDFSQILYLDFAKNLVADMEKLKLKLLALKDTKKANKISGNIRVYNNVISQFEIIGAGVSLQNLDYEVLDRFKNYQLGISNGKATINLYLRTLRAIYNKGVLLHKLPDSKPFKGIFTKLKTRSHSNKKKYLDKESILLFESLKIDGPKQRCVDLFLLQYYFGGCDLIDLYYLYKKQVRRGRVVFERGKTDTDIRIDLKVHPKAARIIAKYTSSDEWLFPWNKDNDYYIGFRRNYQRDLKIIQERYNIEVLPDGGNIAVKVARHTFGNMAKRLRIETDLLRELMGHERDDVDNFYKDRYPENERDDALFKVISSFDCIE